MAVTTSGKDKILRWARAIYGGYDLSGDARTVGTLRNEFPEVDITGWNEDLQNYLSSGVRQIGVDGFQVLMNDTTNRSMDLLKSPDSSNRLSFMFGGGGEPAIGDPAYLMASAHLQTDTSFESSAGVLRARFVMDQSQWDANTSNPLGVVLANQEFTATASLSSHDNGGSTSAGWHANYHCTATSSGNYAFVIEDSANDSAWATLGTFTADGSAVTSEHLSGSGTVDRYVRITGTRTAGSATIVVTFARN